MVYKAPETGGRERAGGSAVRALTTILVGIWAVPGRGPRRAGPGGPKPAQPLANRDTRPAARNRGTSLARVRDHAA